MYGLLLIYITANIKLQQIEQKQPHLLEFVALHWL